jgi:hypothetical protein
LERAERRRVAEREIVPRPPGAERLVGEDVVVADQPAFDAGHAERGKTAGPLVEHARRVVALADGGVAVAGDDEVAAQHAGLERSGGLEPRGESRIPAEPLGGDCQRDRLHGRRRHHQQPWVALEDDLAGIERDHLDGPQRVDVGRIEDLAEPLGRRSGGGRACRRRRRRCLPRRAGAAGRNDQSDHQPGDPPVHRR